MTSCAATFVSSPSSVHLSGQVDLSVRMQDMTLGHAEETPSDRFIRLLRGCPEAKEAILRYGVNLDEPLNEAARKLVESCTTRSAFFHDSEMVDPREIAFLLDDNYLKTMLYVLKEATHFSGCLDLACSKEFMLELARFFDSFRGTIDPRVGIASVHAFVSSHSFKIFPVRAIHLDHTYSLSKGLPSCIPVELIRALEPQTLSIYSYGNSCLPQGFYSLESVETLEFQESPSLTHIPDDIEHLSRLKTLTFTKCHGLISLPEGLARMKSLQEITISDCDGFHDEIPKIRDRLREKGVDLQNISAIHIYINGSLDDYQGHPSVYLPESLKLCWQSGKKINFLPSFFLQQILPESLVMKK
jgi:hypothetical protein